MQAEHKEGPGCKIHCCPDSGDTRELTNISYASSVDVHVAALSLRLEQSEKCLYICDRAREYHTVQ